MSKIGPWIVRVKGTCVGVGIYVCTERELEGFVDESTTPSDCEYALLPHGGVGLDNTPVPLPRGDEEDPKYGGEDGALTESWQNAIYWDRHSNWLPL